MKASRFTLNELFEESKFSKHINMEMLPKLVKIMHVACALADTKDPIIKSQDQKK